METAFEDDERRAAFLLAELAADRACGNGRADVFHQIPRLELGRGVLDERFVRASLELATAMRDCADFALAGLLRARYRYGQGHMLAPALRDAIDQAALAFCYWYDQPGMRMCFHTENHQILFHSCELLAGQLFPRQVFAASGRDGAWHAQHGAALARRWIDHRARFGYAEWLSNCYIEEDLTALLNIYDFALEPELRQLAGQAVDMLLLDLAMHSFGGALASSHGRTYAQLVKGASADPSATIGWLAFGTGQLHLTTGVYHMGTNMAAVSMATSAYRCPPVIQAIAHHQPAELLIRERFGLGVDELPRYDIPADDLDASMILWACQSARHPAVRATAQRLAQAAGDPWLQGFVAQADDRLPACRALAAERGGSFDGDALDTALSPAHIVTFRTPHYQLSSAQDFRPGKPGYQQHVWHAALGRDAAVFTSHPGTADERDDHEARPNFWAGCRWLPRVAQHRSTLICIHHIPPDDPFPFSHAYFPRAAFDELVERGGWVFGRRGAGFVGLAALPGARWAGASELRAPERDAAWVCELGDAAQYGGFADFVAACSRAPLRCEGLRVEYESPACGSLAFGWLGPLVVAGRVQPLHPGPRIDAPYCQAAVGERRIRIRHGADALDLDFR
ncbi:hypothetical protein F8S13_12745 [Chloroflexia bacterium SDU3-3]|nr:hypothetical protein F8S13_12745 [Chloroflexia bacterium SDU3-3]